MTEHLPKKHRRAMIVDGVNTFDDLRLVMAERDMPPAPVKTYTIDIPGGNGELDLTETFLGDAAFGNREFAFTFESLDVDADIERLRDKFVKMVHGKEKEFSFTFDEGYAYKGRFFVDSTKTNGPLQRFVVRINAQPFKTRGVRTEVFGISGGLAVYLSNGRKMSQPTFEFSTDTVVVFEGKRYVMPAGTYTINDVWLREGVNELVFVDVGAMSNLLWEELGMFTWSAAAEKPLYEWYRGIGKHTVSKIYLEGAETPITGVVTFTATGDQGTVKTSSVDLGDQFIGQLDGQSDALTILGDTAYLRKVVKREEDGTYGLLELPDSVTFRFPPLYFNNGEKVASLTCSASASVAYETDGVSITRTVVDTTWADYGEGGVFDMTWDGLSAYTWAKLRRTAFESTEAGSEEVKVIQEEPMETVYVQYEWSDL